MKWDIDKALKPYEPERLIGTSITRFYMDIDFLKQQKLKITPETLEQGGTNERRERRQRRTRRDHSWSRCFSSLRPCVGGWDRDDEEFLATDTVGQIADMILARAPYAARARGDAATIVVNEKTALHTSESER